MSIYPENPENNERDPKTERSEAIVNLLVVAGLAVASVFFWKYVKNTVMFAITLGILVAVHEWGHLVAMKSVGVRVYEFALGFGPKLLTYMRRNGTEYTIRAIPLGGFVYPKGMQPDDPITPDGINGRRPAERALCYLAGPMMNVALAAVILCLTGYLFGTVDESKVLVGELVPKKAASRMVVTRVDGQPVSNYAPGLLAGDLIQKIDGKPMDSRQAVLDMINPNANKEITVAVSRHGQELELKGTPSREEVKGEFLTITGAPAGSSLAVQPGDQLDRIDDKLFLGESSDLKEAQALLAEKAGKPVTLVVWRNGDQRLEVTGPAGPVELAVQPGKRYVGQLGFRPILGMGKRVGLQESVVDGLEQMQFWFRAIIAMFSRVQLLSQNVGGPVAIYDQVGKMERLPSFYYLSFLAQLSLSLAFFNLFPIPILDGGHMLLLTIEVLRRRRLEPQTQRAVAMFGLAIIGMLFVLIFTKDIMRRFGFG